MMTKKQKKELIALVKEGYSFEEIKAMVDCAESTIKKYIRIFKSETNK